MFPDKKEPKTPMEIRLNQSGKEEIWKVVEKIISHSSAEDFLEPVSLKIAPDYLDVSPTSSTCSLISLAPCIC